MFLEGKLENLLKEQDSPLEDLNKMKNITKSKLSLAVLEKISRSTTNGQYSKTTNFLKSDGLADKNKEIFIK